jgi:hypothetical protein
MFVDHTKGSAQALVFADGAMAPVGGVIRAVGVAPELHDRVRLALERAKELIARVVAIDGAARPLRIPVLVVERAVAAAVRAGVHVDDVADVGRGSDGRRAVRPVACGRTRLGVDHDHRRVAEAVAVVVATFVDEAVAVLVVAAARLDSRVRAARAARTRPLPTRGDAGSAVGNGRVVALPRSCVARARELAVRGRGAHHGGRDAAARLAGIVLRTRVGVVASRAVRDRRIRAHSRAGVAGTGRMTRIGGATHHTQAEVAARRARPAAVHVELATVLQTVAARGQGETHRKLGAGRAVGLARAEDRASARGLVQDEAVVRERARAPALHERRHVDGRGAVRDDVGRQDGALHDRIDRLAEAVPGDRTLCPRRGGAVHLDRTRAQAEGFSQAQRRRGDGHIGGDRRQIEAQQALSEHRPGRPHAERGAAAVRRARAGRVGGVEGDDRILGASGGGPQAPQSDADYPLSRATQRRSGGWLGRPVRASDRREQRRGQRKPGRGGHETPGDPSVHVDVQMRAPGRGGGVQRERETTGVGGGGSGLGGKMSGSPNFRGGHSSDNTSRQFAVGVLGHGGVAAASPRPPRRRARIPRARRRASLSRA